LSNEKSSFFLFNFTIGGGVEMGKQLKSLHGVKDKGMSLWPSQDRSIRSPAAAGNRLFKIDVIIILSVETLVFQSQQQPIPII
jgi:hypothetical protein